MSINFKKYHGTGNDFIIIDGMSSDFSFDYSTEQIAHWCHRRYGVGADGLMILRPHTQYDFKMVYYNSDGRLSTMCGNGSRCLVDFAYQLGYINDECEFEAVDGLHEAKVDKLISVRLKDVNSFSSHQDDYFIDTGSPHYVQFCDQVDRLNLIEKAHAIRYNDNFKEEGVNVNFVEATKEGIKVRTYERGVEDETYSCGTGVVASAIAAYLHLGLTSMPIHIATKGGALTVAFKGPKEKEQIQFKDVWLTGPAQEVFSGALKYL